MRMSRRRGGMVSCCFPQPNLVLEKDVRSAAKYPSAARNVPCNSKVRLARVTHCLEPERRRLGDVSGGYLSAEPIISVDSFSTSRPRMLCRAGIELVKQRGAEAIGARDDRDEAVVRSVEGTLIIVVGVVMPIFVQVSTPT